MVSELYELRGIVCSRFVAAKRPLFPRGARVDSLTGCRLASWECWDLLFHGASNLQRLANNQTEAVSRMTTSDECSGVVRRKTDRVCRPVLRSEWFRPHAVGELRPFELDFPWAEVSGDLWSVCVLEIWEDLFGQQYYFPCAGRARVGGNFSEAAGARRFCSFASSQGHGREFLAPPLRRVRRIVCLLGWLRTLRRHAV